MSDNYSIGGQATPDEASEAISEFDLNRTLLAQQLTSDEPNSPEIVHGLKTPEEVFDHFKPSVDIEFEGADGSAVEESLNFRSVGHFSKKSLTEQSTFLNDLNLQNEQYLKILKKLKSNKVIQSVLKDDESKQAMVDTLKGMLQEIEDSDE